MVVFTSICANYLHKARTLAQSIRKNLPDTVFVVCLLERELNENFRSSLFDSIVLAKDAWEGNFERFIFKHSIVEASTAVKGQFFKYLYYFLFRYFTQWKVSLNCCVIQPRKTVACGSYQFKIMCDDEDHFTAGR